MTDHRPQDLFSLLSDETRWLRRRELFYQRALGARGEPGVFHFEDGHDPHVDVYAFERTPGRDHAILITGGLADRAQPLPLGRDAPWRRIELLLRLPRPESWAAGVLRSIAALPFDFGEPLGPGSIVGGSRPVRPGSLLRHVVLSRADEPALADFVVEGEAVGFLLVRFVTAREYAFAEERGGPALLARLESEGVDPVTDLDRPSAV